MSEGGPLVTPKLLGVFLQGGAMEASKDQVVVQVMPGFLEVHIPKDTTICPYDVTRPGPHLLPRPDHDPRPPVPAPRAPAREELFQHVIQSFRSQHYLYFLPPPISLGILQFHVQISCHQQFGAPGLLLERGDNTLYRRGVVRVKVAS